MKKIIVISMFVFVAGFIFAAGADTSVPTPVPTDSKFNAQTVRIAGKFNMKSMGGYSVADMGDELQGLICGVNYLYNGNSTKVIAVMDVPIDNVEAVNVILKDKKAAVKGNNVDSIEKEFKGYKNHFSDKK